MLSPVYEREEDVLCTRASENCDAFEEYDEEAEVGSQHSHTVSQRSGRSSLRGSVSSQTSVGPAIKLALACLGLDTHLSQTLQTSETDTSLQTFAFMTRDQAG